MNYLIKNGYVANSSVGISGEFDVLIIDGKISKISKPAEHIDVPSDVEIIDAKGLHIFPGFIDMHVHMREPGFEEKETFLTGSMAALAGGVTSVAVMPNTKPSPDSVENLKFINDRIQTSSKIDVRVVGAITKSIRGEEIADIKAMAKNGIVGITDDGRACMDMDILEQAFEIAEELSLPVICHCEDHEKTKGISHRDFLNEYETSIIRRDLEMGAKTGAHVHITHLSVKEGLESILEFKARGVNVTCDVTAHHIALNKDMIDMDDPMTKVNPPIRSKADMESMIQGILDGSIEAIASDHAPHEMESKTGDIDKCSFGISGIEVSFPICYTELCVKRKFDIVRLTDMMTINPARILGIDGGVIAEGHDANISIIDLNGKFEIDPMKFVSKGKNNPMKGYVANGIIKATFFKGDKLFFVNY